MKLLIQLEDETKLTEPLTASHFMDLAWRMNRMALAQWAAEEAAGRLHNTEKCRKDRLTKLYVLRGALMDLGKRLAPELKGMMVESQIAELIDAEVRTILVDFSS